MAQELTDKDIGYREGYGQAKADLLLFIKEAMFSVERAIDDAKVWDATDEQVAALKLRHQELKRVRGLIKAIRSKR
jgi:hypothetical protein